jgi:hypothetical protein
MSAKKKSEEKRPSPKEPPQPRQKPKPKATAKNAIQYRWIAALLNKIPDRGERAEPRPAFRRDANQEGARAVERRS